MSPWTFEHDLRAMALRENACPEPDSLRYVAAEVFRCSTCA